MKVEFTSILEHINIKIPLAELPARDKVELCRWLLDDLGITERLCAGPDENKSAQTIINEQWNKSC